MILIADVTPKLKLFLFISIISLLINLSVVACSYAQETNTPLTTGMTQEEINNENVNASTEIYGKIAVAGTTSFIPFFDLLNIITLNLAEIPLFAVIYAVIVSILSAIKTFILIAIIVNLLPFFNA